MRYLILTLLAFVLVGASIDDARKANEAYNNEQYKKAISLYKKAIDANPKNAKLYFNLASAQAQAGKTQEAIRTFEQYKTMTNNAEEQAKANYNIGKVLSDTKKWGRAVDYYKKSLRYMADDPDAKHNYELAKQKEKQEQKKNKQQKNNQNQQNNDQQKKNEQQKQKQNQQTKDNNEQQQQNQQQQNQQKQDQNKQQQPKPQKMSKAEAQKILQALEQKEKELLQQFKKKKTKSSKSKNEKDW
ncbi:MAG: tetratricopeptide repeat protein [Fodinibius sp.]|nr:tetratricopeptide repeat protein [Fodinibius sp.]